MKIMIFMKELSGGGAERTIVNILNHLDKSKFETVFVIANNQINDYADYIKEGTKFIDLNSPLYKYSFFKFRRVIIQEKPDLIFTTIFRTNLFAGLTNATLGKRIPLVTREVNYRTESKKVTPLKRLLAWFTYNLLSDAVVAISKGVKEDLNLNFHVSNKRIRTIYNPVDIELIDRLKLEKVEDLPVSEGYKKVIAVGRFVGQKDYPTLLKAFHIVVSRLSAKLVILGKGPLECEMKQLAADLNMKDLVSFKGFVKNPYKYIHNADVFVLTSKWEGFSHVVAEALACGVPVVSTDCKAGPREILKDGLYGRLAPVGDYEKIAEEIIDVLKSDNDKVISEGIVRVQDFEAGKMVAEYENLFIELINIRKKKS